MALYYLAYGSNLHPYRLRQRVPSAELVGVVVLPGKRLTFQKRSRDGSAKCMFVETGSGSHDLYGAVYSIDPGEKAALDHIEGVGFGYELNNVRVRLDGVDREAFTYAATTSHIRPELSPYHWYKELVLLGAQYHGLPASYIDAIASTVSVADPDENRVRQKAGLLDAMRAINETATSPR